MKKFVTMVIIVLLLVVLSGCANLGELPTVEEIYEFVDDVQSQLEEYQAVVDSLQVEYQPILEELEFLKEQMQELELLKEQMEAATNQ